MKSNVISITWVVGRRLLAKTRIDASSSITEVTGVTCGDSKAAWSLVVLSAAYAINLLSENVEIAELAKRMVQILDPDAELVVEHRKLSNQPSLLKDDDIPF